MSNDIEMQKINRALEPIRDELQAMAMRFAASFQAAAERDAAMSARIEALELGASGTLVAGVSSCMPPLLNVDVKLHDPSVEYLTNIMPLIERANGRLDATDSSPFTVELGVNGRISGQIRENIGEVHDAAIDAVNKAADEVGMCPKVYGANGAREASHESHFNVLANQFAAQAAHIFGSNPALFDKPNTFAIPVWRTDTCWTPSGDEKRFVWRSDRGAYYRVARASHAASISENNGHAFFAIESASGTVNVHRVDNPHLD